MAAPDRPMRHETRLRRADGTDVPVQVTASWVAGRPEGQPAHLVMIVEDITERKALEAALVHRSLHDPLTGLPNRLLFQDRLWHALERGRRENTPTCVLITDLDGFKAINDELGHPMGDLVLVTFAERLRSVLRASDTAARLGGDEFSIVCENTEPADADVLAERLRTLGHRAAAAGRDDGDDRPEHRHRLRSPAGVEPERRLRARRPRGRRRDVRRQGPARRPPPLTGHPGPRPPSRARCGVRRRSPSAAGSGRASTTKTVEPHDVGAAEGDQRRRRSARTRTATGRRRAETNSVAGDRRSCSRTPPAISPAAQGSPRTSSTGGGVALPGQDGEQEGQQDTGDGEAAGDEPQHGRGRRSARPAGAVRPRRRRRGPSARAAARSRAPGGSRAAGP